MIIEWGIYNIKFKVNRPNSLEYFELWNIKGVV